MPQEYKKKKNKTKNEYTPTNLIIGEKDESLETCNLIKQNQEKNIKYEQNINQPRD